MDGWTEGRRHEETSLEGPLLSGHDRHDMILAMLGGPGGVDAVRWLCWVAGLWKTN